MEDLTNELETSGEQNTPPKMVCPSCGAAIRENQKFCDNCGADLNAPPKQKAEPKKKSYFVPAIIAMVAIFVAAFIFIQRATKPNFKQLYDMLCDPTWAQVGSDGSYLSIDTNPYDYDDSGLYCRDAYVTIPTINGMLGLPDSLFNQMNETSASDGRQTETYNSKNVTVTWKYHPNTGLEVTYKKIH